MSDYARIADAIRFIASQVARQPTLDEIAAHVHLSPFHFQRLFSRWAGVTIAADKIMICPSFH